MERQMKKCRQMSPERARVSLEGSSNQGRVQVIYYLSRNHHLEHPHFIEVPLSSPEGLYLKDVMDRLNFMRGRGMPSMYSWSCKRSYKNGFVWHDLCGEDLILPAQGNEYILKGSELFQDSHSDLVQTSSHVMLQNIKPLKQSKMSVLDREMNPCQEEQLSLPHNCVQSSALYVQSRDGIDPSRSPSKKLTEYNVDKGIGRADASTQTDEIVRRARTRQRCKEAQNQVLTVKENSELCRDEVSISLSSSSTSSGRRTGTLESLMKADSSTMTSFRTLDEGNADTSSSVSNRTVDVLMQLISCGSISVNDHAFGFIPGYKPRLSNLKIPSPLHSSSEILGELNYASQDRRLVGSRMEDKEYFSGSLIETKTNRNKDGGCNSLKRSSSYNADRTRKLVDTIAEDGRDTRSKCIPQSLKSSLRPRREPIRSPVSQARRNSSADVEASHLIPLGVFNDASQRTTVTSLVKTSLQIRDSCREEGGKVTRIEERLPSGARVIIQSKAVPDIVHV